MTQSPHFPTWLIFPSAFLCTDLSPTASLCTLQTAARNKVLLNPLTTTLVSSLLPRLANAVDLILFNPPYVVTDPLEVLEAQDLVARAEQVEGGRGREIEGIDKAWAGGADGMEVTDLLLPFVPVCLFDLEESTDPSEAITFPSRSLLPRSYSSEQDRRYHCSNESARTARRGTSSASPVEHFRDSS